MRLPPIQYQSKPLKINQERFSGIERNLFSGDGSIYDMSDISTSDFPILSTIPKRKKIKSELNYGKIWHYGSAIGTDYVISGDKDFGECEAWKSGENYSEGDVTLYKDVIYKRKSGTGNNEINKTSPNLNPAFWEVLPYSINGIWYANNSVKKNSIYWHEKYLYVNLTGANTETSPDNDVENWARYRYADFYYNEEKINGTQLIAGKKECSYLNGYIVIIPDKMYYHVDSGKFGYLEGKKSGVINISDYTGYFKPGYGFVSKVINPYLTDGKRFDAEGMANVIEFFWDAANGGHQSPGPDSDNGVFDLRKFFRPEETVKITQKSKSGLKISDGTYVITDVKLNALIFKPSSFAGADTSDLQDGEIFHIGGNVFQWIGGVLYLEKVVPELDFLCVSGNRMWGCYEDTVYASALGNCLEWNRYSGRENDPIYLESGEEGSFTGCCEYGGYPVFFKQNELYRVYGSGYSSFALSKAASYGLKKDSPHSTCVVNSILFFLSDSGVCAYNGGVPSIISESLKRRLSNAIAGTDGKKYYLSVYDGYSRKLYVYDTDNRMWTSENFEDVPLAMISNSITLKCVTDGGDQIVIAHPEESAGQEIEPSKNAYIEFNDFYENSIDKKNVGKILIKASVNPVYNPLKIYIQYNSDGKWNKVGEIHNNTQNKSVSEFSFYPRRCDHYRIKLECKGEFTLYSLARQVI